MTAFDRAWELLKRQLPDPPTEKPPPCSHCGNTETQWRMDQISSANWRLGMTDTIPYYSVWCKNWFADPEKGEDEGCELLSHSDTWAEMQIQDTWKNALFPDLQDEGDGQ